MLAGVNFKRTQSEREEHAAHPATKTSQGVRDEPVLRLQRQGPATDIHLPPQEGHAAGELPDSLDAAFI